MFTVMDIGHAGSSGWCGISVGLSQPAVKIVTPAAASTVRRGLLPWLLVWRRPCATKTLFVTPGHATAGINRSGARCYAWTGVVRFFFARPHCRMNSAPLRRGFFYARLQTPRLDGRKLDGHAIKVAYQDFRSLAAGSG